MRGEWEEIGGLFGVLATVCTLSPGLETLCVSQPSHQDVANRQPRRHRRGRTALRTVVSDVRERWSVWRRRQDERLPGLYPGGRLLKQQRT